MLRIPAKRAPIHTPVYLDPEEVAAILAQPDRSTLEGQRDHALLSFLYNSGARIQEALDLKPQAIHFDAPAFVRLYGKGRKERLCPLWPETVVLLKALLKRQPRTDDEPIFVNRYGVPLGASGVRFKLAECVQAAAKTMPSLATKKVTPHSFRHSTAVHLVAAGVDSTVIRSVAGAREPRHHQPLCSGRRPNAKAIDRLDTSGLPTKPPRWKRDASVMAWLDTLRKREIM